MTKGSRDRRPGVMRLHQSIAQRLGTAILCGEYPPGAHLGGEIAAAGALGVSRTAYREGLRILIAKGLLESRPRAGTHVTPRARWNLLDPDVLAWMFSSTPDPIFTRDLFELRGVIEPAAAALAATRRSAADLAAMRAALDAMRAEGLASERGQAADRRFHDTLLRASGNEALAALSSTVGAAVQWTTRFKQRAHGTPRDRLPEHVAVFDAIAAGDGPAADVAMRSLVELALADMAPAAIIADFHRPTASDDPV